MMITGMEYYARKSQTSRRRLAALAGISPVTFYAMCAGEGIMKRSVALYERAAEFFGVEVSQLLQSYDDSELSTHDCIRYPSRTENLSNPVAVYRKQHNLTYAQLGERLGNKTRECARQACAAKHPRKKHIRVLAAYEGVTPEQFCRLYAPNVEV